MSGALLDINVWPAMTAPGHLLGHRQITDAHLLALAVQHGGWLVTFGPSIPPQLVRGASSKHLVTI